MNCRMPTIAAFAMAAALVAPCQAQDYPTQTVKIIIPFGPGGGSDIVGRIIGQRMQEKLGQPIVIENRPGAGGLARQRGDRQFAEGWLHARHHDRGPDHLLGDDQGAALRHAQGLRLGRADRHRRPRHRGAQRRADQKREGADRRRQGQPRQAGVRQPRLRRDPAPRHRAVQAGGRRQHAARAVPHLARGVHRPARQAGRRADRNRVGAARPDPGRPGPGASPSPARIASRRCRTCRPRWNPAPCRTTT